MAGAFVAAEQVPGQGVPDSRHPGLAPGAGRARGAVQFFIKGKDVVVNTPKGEFVTILKNGINSKSVQNALEASKRSWWPF